MNIEHGSAICYSGYREDQSPQTRRYPSHEQIREDLNILRRQWKYLRLYDCSPHAERVLEVIRDQRLDLKVMLGVDMAAEVSNPRCPWGADYPQDVLDANRVANDGEIGRLIELTREFSELVNAVSVGNEATVEWTDHMVPVERLVDHANTIRKEISQPITFCENYVPWTNKLSTLANVLDFISIHTYPAWEYRSIDDALDYTKDNYLAVAECYPDKPVIISEAGWTTKANGRGIEPANASEALQAAYYKQLKRWTMEEQILTYVFEAFDEPWKGSDDPLEPEKHWGLFRVDRSPKQVIRETYPALIE